MKAELPGKIEIQSVSEKIMDVMLFVFQVFLILLIDLLT